MSSRELAPFPGWVTAAEAATIIGVSKERMRQLIYDNNLFTNVFRFGRYVVIKKWEVVNYAAHRKLVETRRGAARLSAGD